MNTKQFYLFTMLLFLFSCKPSNPETILGIKLGLPEKSQITDVIQAGKIKMDGERQYVDYGKLRGYLMTRTATNTSDIEILTDLSLKFVNPDFRLPNIPEDRQDNEWVSEFDIQNLIETYKGKYGEPEYENNNGYEKRTWKRGDMEIKLSSNKFVQSLGKIYCNASASYFYKTGIREEILEEEKKNNKSI